MTQQCDIAIIGTGPAGLTAGIYASRARLNTLLLENRNFGGYVPNIDLIDNFSGAANISGKDLAANMLAQIRSFGARMLLTEALGIRAEGRHIVLETDADAFETKALIIASGANPKKLGVPGEEELSGKGVIYCATCDGHQFQDKVVAVAGGGDSALTEAFNLSKIAREVVIIELMDDLTGTCVLRDKVIHHPKIEVLCGVKIEKINGNGSVQSLDLLDMDTRSTGKLDVDGILVHIGRTPNTVFADGVVPLDEHGFILVDQQMETRVPGIYAAGDVRSCSPMQIISACGDGAVAAMAAIRKMAGQ